MEGKTTTKISLTIPLLIVVCFVSYTARAQYGGGSGATEDPYLIYTTEQMNEIGLHEDDWDKCFKLMRDIDLSIYTGIDFNIIGYYRSEDNDKPFTGVFNGNGCTISNFSYISTDRSRVGIFGYVSGENAEIKDLGLIDPKINAGMGLYVGSLVGYLRDGKISNCYVDGGSVSADGEVGGLVGGNYDTITDCYSVGSVTGRWIVGGLIGLNDGDITNCYSMGTVTGDDRVAGLVGYNGFDASITTSSSIGTVSGGWSTGGLTGENKGTINASYSTCRVNGDYEVGGLVGDNSYRGRVNACYSIGVVRGNEHIGGLVGRGQPDRVINSFWDIQTSGLTTSAGGTGQTTARMQTANTFLNASWDFLGEIENGLHEIWQIPEGGGYPLLGVFNDYRPPILPGKGTSESPYLISTAAELGSVIYRKENACYRLVHNIDLSGINWSMSVIPYLGGVFDGYGFTISNLTMVDSMVGYNHLGLIGTIRDGGQVLNLGVVDVNVVGIGNYAVGGLVGINDGGYVTRCYSTGSINSDSLAGGLVGDNLGAVANCYSNCSVSGTGVGGLVGRNLQAVTHCYSTGAVRGTENFVGGLVGHNIGAVSHCYSTGTVNGSHGVGGLVGSSWGLSGIYNSFWDIETSGQQTSNGGTGQTTAQMQDIRTYLGAGWDWIGEIENGTSEIWQMPEGGGYPILAFFSGYTPPQLQGLGTPENPYLIFNSMELGAIVYHRPYGHYRLAVSIDLSDIRWGTAVIPWFAGTLEGDELTISHLTIEGGGYLGLFGQLQSRAEVKNLGVVDVRIVGTDDYIGGFVGDNNGQLVHCYSIITVSGNSTVGGLVGGNSGDLVNCYSIGAVSGNWTIGGLVGKNRGFVNQCYSANAVCSNKNVGGLVGSGNPSRVADSFWDKQASGQVTSEGGTGLATAEMQTASTFLEAGWDFVDETANGTEGTWWINEGQDYPRLRELPEGLWLRPILAFCPDPQDSVTDVTQQLILHWAPAFPILQNDIYLGEDKEAVANATTMSLGIYRGRQPGNLNTYDPGHLKWGKTYYWRIDEVDEVDPSSPWKGNVWSFTTVDFITLLYPPEGATDVIWPLNLSWLPVGAAQYYDIYFGEDKDTVANATLRSLGIYQGRQAPGMTTYDTGGLEWGKSYYWRIDGLDEADPNNPCKGRVWSFTTMDFVTLPYPPDGATDISPSPIIGWMPAGPNLQYDVYFGEDKDTVANATPESLGIYQGRQIPGMTTYEPGDLESGKTYYWRIDEVNEVESSIPWKGNVWSFTTAFFLVVDDFESYTDICEEFCNRIYLAWVDGFNNPSINGSIVGHDTPPFVEQTIVHSGKQSMPLYYDNSGPANYSEATMTLTSLREWTIEGVGVLSMWFYGDQNNAPEPMHVALASAKGLTVVIYHDDPYATQVDTWTEWRINLQAFADQGVNLANVIMITIGFGNKINPVAGGAGIMYFDDIRLYRSTP